MADLLINGVTYAGVSSISVKKTDGTYQEFVLEDSEMIVSGFGQVIGS